MWQVIGKGVETAIYETGDGTLSYEDAKARAVDQLAEFLQPALLRLEEIKADRFQSEGKRPEFRAWRDHYGARLVIAKTKKRAAELDGCSRSTFERHYTEETGFWWYEHAREESVWEEENRHSWKPDRKLKKVWPKDSPSQEAEEEFGKTED